LTDVEGTFIRKCKEKPVFSLHFVIYSYFAYAKVGFISEKPKKKAFLLVIRSICTTFAPDFRNYALITG